MALDAQRALSTLLELTAKLTEERPLEEFLNAVTTAAVELLGADHASIRVVDAAEGALVPVGRSGTGHTSPPIELRKGTGVLGWVVEHGLPARIDDVELDPRWVKVDLPSAAGAAPAGTPPRQGFVVRSIMVEPLRAGPEVIGALAVTSPAVGRFGDDDQLLLRLLANCSSAPIERARLRRLAMIDDMTHAFNHRYLVPRLVEEMERATRSGSDLSLLYMDLDHFKNVNDAYGHATGDDVLRMFADRVRRAVRRVDLLVRRGGEEFVLVMPQTGITQAHLTAQRIKQALDGEPLEIGDGARLRQTVSIGVATWDKHESPLDLERRADRAMYEAKRLGRNRVVVAT